MTMIRDEAAFADAAPVMPVAETPRFSPVRDAYWGFTIRSDASVDGAELTGRGVVLLVGAAATLAALGMWLVPSADFLGPALPLKLGAAVVLGALASVLMHWGTRGRRVTLEIDTSMGEVRQVVTHLTGRSEVLAVHGFDAVTGLRIVAAQGRVRHSQLQIDLSDGSRIAAGEGAPFSLAALKARIETALGHDARGESVAAEHFTGWTRTT